MMLPSRFSFRIVGVTFVEQYPENIRRLLTADDADVRVGYFPQEALPVVLLRDPGNVADSNAIEVHAPAVGLLGHVPRRLAARLAPALDAGERWGGEVEQVWVREEHPDRPGVSITVHRVNSNSYNTQQQGAVDETF